VASGFDELPISKTVTGIILELEPGALRGLHWHPSADEWHYVISGDVSVTLFGSHARYRIETLSSGDVDCIPQDYGHSIENIGNKAARLLIDSIPEFMRRSTSLNGSPEIHCSGLALLRSFALTPPLRQRLDNEIAHNGADRNPTKETR
jgi:quercetin dioxygenase-like cupin family protein